MKTTFPKFASCRRLDEFFPKLLQEAVEELDESLPNKEEVYRQAYEEGYRDAVRAVQSENKEALQVVNMVSSQISSIELSENVFENICQYLVELFESAFRRFFLICPVNLDEVVKALLDTVKSKQISVKVKIEVSPQSYEKLKRARCLSWPSAELCINAQFASDQCRLSYLDIVIEYEKKFLQSELESVLSSAQFTYKV